MSNPAEPQRDGAPRPQRILFVTGRLAEASLRQVLAELRPPFECEVAVLGISVAALMTTEWMARSLKDVHGADLVLIPGLCEGDPAVLSRAVNTPVEKGPADLRELPEYFGRPPRPPEYGRWDIEIVAEINNAPRLGLDEIVTVAEYYRASGADVIDVGCTPGLAFPALSEVVRDLTGRGMQVSIDTFDVGEIRTAVAAGARLVLSVNQSTVDVLPDVRGTGARVVVVPLEPAAIDSLDPCVAAAERAGIKYLIDPILQPIGHGFMASLERYAEVRRRYPGAEMLMGVGNVTELTAADTTGVHAILIAICQELQIRAVLTTEVMNWARGAVREIDIARRLMRYAVSQNALPKGVDDRLVTVKDPRQLAFSEAQLRALQAELTDPNLRIFADGSTITALNHQQFVRGSDVQDIFERLGVTEPGHAFYLGCELAHARLAVALGKTYRQDAPLSWGYLTPAMDPSRRKRVRLTARAGESSGGRSPLGEPGDEDEGR